MCHHFDPAVSLPSDFVAEYYLRDDQASDYCVIVNRLGGKGAWPRKVIPALRIDGAGELEVFGAEWGLLPSWWKPGGKCSARAKFQSGTYNARGETAATKPTYRDAMRKRRCLVPFDEFFELGHYFGIGEPMAFAGLWESWLGEEGEVLSVSFLTTDPNAEVRSVGHDRMPVLLATPADRLRWLTEGAREETLRPLADGRLSIRRKG